MEDKLKKLADQVHQLLQERRLYLYRASIQKLDQILQALQKYKSECTSTIATVKTLLLRKREIKFNQNHSRALEELFYEMVKHNKAKEEGEIYRLWFEKLKRLKSYSFELSESSLYVVPPRNHQEKEAPERTLQNYRYLENLMKEDIISYLQMIMVQYQINYLRMPVEHLRYFLEGLKKHNCYWKVIQRTSIILAYKMMSKMDVSEEQLRENRLLLERMYDELVNKNLYKADAEVCRNRFISFEQKFFEDFIDGAYIRGDDLDRFREKREKSSEQQTHSELSDMITRNEELKFQNSSEQKDPNLMALEHCDIQLEVQQKKE